MTDTTQIISKFDRIYGGLVDVSLSTKASTVKNVQAVTGKSETFIIQTCRHEVLKAGSGNGNGDDSRNPEYGDTIFIEVIDENGVVRIALPPKVANLIASQRDALTAKGRSLRGKRVMAERMASGDWKPPVPPKRRKKA